MRARVERAAQIPGTRKRRQNDDPRLWMPLADFRGQGLAGHLRHFYIRYQNIGLATGYCCQRLAAIPGLPDHCDVRLGLEQSCQRAQHHRLVFRDYYLYLLIHS